MSMFWGFTTKIKYQPRVVWAEEPKTGLGFEIGPSHDDVPTTSQCLTDGQTSYTSYFLLSRSDIRSDTSFEFLSPNYTGRVTCFFCKTSKHARLTSCRIWCFPGSFRHNICPLRLKVLVYQVWTMVSHARYDRITVFSIIQSGCSSAVGNIEIIAKLSRNVNFYLPLR